MKICMVAYSFYETDNRIRRYAETLAKRGDQVDAIVLRRDKQPNFEIINGVNVFRVQKRQVDETGQFSYLFKLLRFLIKSSILLTKKHFEKRYDLVHAHNVPDFQIFAAWFPKMTRSALILDIHDILPEFYASKFKKTKKSLIYKLLIIIEKLSSSFADHVIISNHIWAKTITSRSVSKEKCTAILNYPDTGIFYERPVNRKNGKFLMIYPGTLNKHQGLDIAIKSFAKVKKEVPDAEFHIYGRGEAKNSLIDLVSKLDLDREVIFHKPIPLENIADEMANADLGIIPKRNDSFGGEAFSTKTLEFMALKVPIIVSKTKIDQYYFDESVVEYFTPGDEKDLTRAMLLLINNKQLRNRLKTNASKYVKQNNWEEKKQIYLDLVDSLVNP